MKRFLYLIILYIPLFVLSSCDVHELPERSNVHVPFMLHLNFDTELPLYKEIPFTRTRANSDETKGYVDTHDVRYTIKAYRTDATRANIREADATFVFTQSDIFNLDFTAPIELPEGEYEFQVWADFIDAGTKNDKYYLTNDFSEIILADKKDHEGNNDYRDAFRGYAKATVINAEYYAGEAAINIDNRATVKMQRPMGKFKFIATDVDLFLTRVIETMKEKGERVEFSTNTESAPDADSRALYEQMLEAVKLEDFRVVFRYNLYMPCSFNMFTDKPADSWTGMSFESFMYSDAYNEMTLGFDYVFVNGAETTLSISVDVYDKDGELISSTNPLNVPIVRSKLTVVKGNFLTSKASEGVTISPDFDGEYNVPVNFN